MIPGSKPKIEPTAKVRIGEKRATASGGERPAALDYFVCDDDQFGQVAGDKPATIRIQFVHPLVDDAFSTGLEWWSKKRGAAKPTLACYTKDGGSNPVALRLDKMLDEGQEPIAPPRGAGRLPIACLSRECPHFKNKDCRPMGRLVFLLDGGTHVYQIDTKAWNSIERLEGSLRLAQARGPLDAPGRLFDLSVEMVTKGRDHFPVMTIQEVQVEVNNVDDVLKADALVALVNALAEPDSPEVPLRGFLAHALDRTNPGWRDNPAYVERIKAVGVRAAAEGVVKANL